MARWFSKGGLLSDECEPWQPITPTTPSMVWIEVTGPSGMITWPWFLTIARLECDSVWVDPDQNNLEDYGWHPAWWRPLSPRPPVQPPRSTE